MHGTPTGSISLNQTKGAPDTTSNAPRRVSRETSLRFSTLHKNRAYHREPYHSSNASVSVINHDDQVSPLPSPNSVSQPVPTTTAHSSYFQQIRESRAFWLVLYFFFNLGLTLYNKGVLVHFPFPYTLTAVHALCGSLGSSLLARAGFFVPAKLSRFQRMVVTAFSVLYAVNIVVSNVSLQLVTVPFHQVVRAVTPVFTIILSSLLLGTKSTRQRVISLIPVVAGVGLATYGDYYFTRWGFFLTLFGAILAALKTILTNVLQTRPSSLTAKFNMSTDSPALPQLNPLAFLHLLSPLAFLQCIFFAQLSGELSRVQHYAATELTSSKALAVAFNGCIAFGLNVVSFSANRRCGALSMAVAANVKQVLTILLAVLIFNLTITQMNMMGIILTLAGGAWYARVEYVEKRFKVRRVRAM
ncbi:TPT-domain-containing protein [Marasmius fiardii PR-910]|nr:TPT-domain-containing protein [Marasmius fiardii PR-910]